LADRRALTSRATAAESRAIVHGHARRRLGGRPVTERLGQQQADQLALGLDDPDPERGALLDLSHGVGEGVAAFAEERYLSLRWRAADPGQHQRLPLLRSE